MRKKWSPRSPGAIARSGGARKGPPRTGSMNDPMTSVETTPRVAIDPSKTGAPRASTTCICGVRFPK